MAAVTEFGPAAGVPGSHVVQFYGSDEQLTPTVASYVAEAVRAGGVALIFARAGHRVSFANALADRGVDVAAARRGGALVERDTADTLRRLADQHGVDPSAFDEVIGVLVRAAVERGGPVRVYGEMAGLLRERQELQRALLLEQQWNELDTGMGFCLLCSYPHPQPDHAAAAWQIAQVHSAVHQHGVPSVLTLQAPDVASFYDPDPRSAGRARAMVREVLGDWHLEQIVDDAAVVISELATNAIGHARSGFAVTLTRTDAGARLTVTDSSPAPAERRTPPATEPGGRGMLLVDHLSRRWGVTPGPHGKAVWAELGPPLAPDDHAPG